MLGKYKVEGKRKKGRKEGRKKNRRGKKKKRERPPATPVKSTGMDSHTRLELCTTLWGPNRGDRLPGGDP